MARKKNHNKRNANRQCSGRETCECCEVIQACADEGISITMEHLEAELVLPEDDEFTEESLDHVSGSVSISLIHRLIQHCRASRYNSDGGGFSKGGISRGFDGREIGSR